MFRSHTCGELTTKHIDQVVELAGWVNSTRDHGGLIFIDLRDRFGLTQCTFNPEKANPAWKIAETVRPEFVVKIKGTVTARPPEMVNPNLKTGSIEIIAEKIEILSHSETPPFIVEWRPKKTATTGEPSGGSPVTEELRLKYRYLDLRTERMITNLTLRHKLINYIREYLNKENFLEIETPILTKSTPEGARDYIVPSRLHPGKFFALPQSPQQYKQLLMLAGVDRYYQVARCFRDEDQRGDRQSEFTQLDMEMSFVERDDIISLTENLFKSVFKRLISDGLLNKKIELEKSWIKIPFEEAMVKYGVDRPDIRFGLEIKELSAKLQNSNFQVFSQAMKEKNGVIRTINAKASDKVLSRGEIDKLTVLVKEHGAKGLAYIRVESAENGDVTSDAASKKLILLAQTKLLLNSPIIKFLSDDELKAILTTTEASAGDVIFFGAGERKIVEAALGALRLELGKKLKLIDPNELAICWIIDFPLFEREPENGHFAPSHHMFTAPNPADLPLLDSDPGKVKSWQYDLVINGLEVGGGSIRIHDPRLQEKIFSLIGFDENKKQEFVHMLTAFQYGAPPHGGIAPGIDRIAMILAGEPNIREMMAFPKSQKAEDLMMNAPSEVEEKQLKEAHIKLDN
ncbi:MAG: aspartate--tRNA ligase [Candidatus Jacksonbacteria bacterium RIFOXYC2_FULL_44_29]|nr:MAG: Aspartate-tRNA ligase [Parcubacteria group bacterium GW2011_GWA2_42_28]KKT56232.1 MAG: Aspartate-tRNA ligase [Parcubacteria group bacterium GW2011_GWC2_44_22]OGY76120.1 MAG: aspartate--tRNA ligase [Candidatus Jacksonbacteria bacterium RIFOXYA2_FULL_43_12]OGY77711.1 MAG: aspartate--tRNA ligase [Candidatus Jacksonbacteria bacterium RIFOXYB2_FULL_44_15]OGY78847.1 MAG: aspartate--tRNA ligase [Candidatus Jacksonbacteria bacterium RIFOXYD2_FULL_43_21]OGY80187.1 MAG: aspartate--tRNA ligase [C